MRGSERFGCARNRFELAWLFKFTSPSLGELSQIVKSVCALDGARCGRCHRNVILLLTFISNSSQHVVALAIVLLSLSVILMQMLQTNLGRLSSSVRRSSGVRCINLSKSWWTCCKNVVSNVFCFKAELKSHRHLQLCLAFRQ